MSTYLGHMPYRLCFSPHSLRWLLFCTQFAEERPEVEVKVQQLAPKCWSPFPCLSFQAVVVLKFAVGDPFGRAQPL